jgi:UDP-N-acetylglucosamine/UDP-N-acetylgalactosamine diphosphorylase
MATKRILTKKGVTLIEPETISIAEDVNTGHITAGAVIHPGCRLSGSELSIAKECVIGAEGPATVNNCQLGVGVHLAGGYFDNSTFLDGFKAGSCSHVRSGCLFEEESSIAHSVGTKQTIFLPWVTAGSLINFCDCLMAGGTSRRNHSEIGSSYIHFNFTPHQDKATPSLIGDVPRGVLLNQPPIFLGGQGGMVGPASIPFGTVLPAGQIWRGEHTKPGQIVMKKCSTRNLAVPFDAERYNGITRIVRSNLRYIGNLVALDQWYRVVRSRYMMQMSCSERCWNGARKRVREMFDERIKRLDDLAQKIEKSLALPGDNPFKEEHREFLKCWETGRDKLTELIQRSEDKPVPGRVELMINELPGTDYIDEIKGLPPETVEEITVWLYAYVEDVEAILGV